ncbi:NAD(P)H-dependent glycerol-3-phosphate dehydrogenase [Mycoplasmopsis hyopharyngis]|uniref:NAD(P)H-dependent glycerol-3-phosphate dehydrogenase n=1 Tax=Mycoplasmopsis hyopharyngis TaxID=29558 RepID=UPI003872A87B
MNKKFSGQEQKTIAILGTGAWGSALANVLSKNNYKVIMWGINQSEIDDINMGKNTRYFEDTNFINHRNISATNNLEQVISQTNDILLAVPSSAVVEVLNLVKNLVPNNKKINIINVAKGIEAKSKKFFSDIIKDELQEKLDNYCTLIGPSFAIEVFHNKLTMINVVGPNKKFLERICSIFNNDTFRLVITNNEKGAELFAALKNVLALGIGIVSYFFPFSNTIAASLSIGVKEIAFLYKNIFHKEKNDADNIGFQLAGIGDIFLTCSSTKSRNYTFGLQVAEKGLTKALQDNKNTVEGYHAAQIINEIIQANNLAKEMPFINSIIEILYRNKDANLILDFTKEYQ